MKLCIDCKHCWSPEFGEYCARFAHEKPSYVDGRTTICDVRPCEGMRADRPTGTCGPDAKHWEAKDGDVPT